MDVKIIFTTILSVLGLLYIFEYISMMYFKESNKDSAVVIIVKNAEDFIEGIIRKFYQQGCFKPEELWIIDRGSEDQTPEILKKLALKYTDLHVVFLPEMPFEVCAQKVIGDLDSPAILLIDGTRLDYKDIINKMGIVLGQRMSK